MSDEQLEENLDLSDEYEEICSDEVDRVVEVLEQLAESVSSENIRVMLEEASQSVYELVYEEEEDAETDGVEAEDNSEEVIAFDQSLSDESASDDDEGLAAEAA